MVPVLKHGLLHPVQIDRVVDMPHSIDRIGGDVDRVAEHGRLRSLSSAHGLTTLSFDFTERHTAMGMTDRPFLSSAPKVPRRLQAAGLLGQIDGPSYSTRRPRIVAATKIQRMGQKPCRL